MGHPHYIPPILLKPDRPLRLRFSLRFLLVCFVLSGLVPPLVKYAKSRDDAADLPIVVGVAVCVSGLTIASTAVSLRLPLGVTLLSSPAAAFLWIVSIIVGYQQNWKVHHALDRLWRPYSVEEHWISDMWILGGFGAAACLTIGLILGLAFKVAEQHDA